MRVMGAETALATGTTKFTTAGAVRLLNTSGSAQVVTVRNAADDGDVGTISLLNNMAIVITLGTGEGLRGNAGVKGTQIVASGF